MVIQILKSIFCRHTYVMVEKVKDEDVESIGGVSRWKCSKCHKMAVSQYTTCLK